MKELHFRLLGPMAMTMAGRSVSLPGAAERALLAQLLLAPGRTVAATMLVDRLWSESTLPVDPMNALQIRVSKLRRALRVVGAPDLVVRSGVGYLADVDRRDVDAVDFGDRIRAARAHADAAAPSGHDETHLGGFDAALALWQGEPLSDFITEHWAAAEAARLTEVRLLALTERAQIALALGRHMEVIADIEPLVAADPTLEALAGLLMVAQYRGGRQADALEVFSRTRKVLDEKLGLEPSQSLRSLQERVLRQDESLGTGTEIAPAAPVTASMVRRAVAQSTAPTNLPTVVRPLIGREDLLDALTELVSGARLVTLIGPGGAGKTSLALAVAVSVSSAFPDGVYGVRLASVNADDQVPLAVADALGVPMDGAATERDVGKRLVAFLEHRTMLLVLDSCEHVIDAAAGLADTILGRCSGVVVLATSREALATPDEIQVTVGPLHTPPEGTLPAEMLTYPAVQLLTERARAIRLGTVFDEADLLAWGRISRALDGIPLALELAAARSTSMSPAEISDRLEHRFSLLTSGSRTAEARQQTLRATVDWSYALLPERERRVFNRLSVFQGGWTLEAAEAVVGDDTMAVGSVLDTIARLAERSMVVVEPGSSTRYRMLETLRQYAAENLAGSGETMALAVRHAKYFQQLVRSSEAAMRGRGQRQELIRLRQEQPNIRAALAWLSGPDGDADQALTTAGSLGLFWHLGRHLEGRDLLARLLRTGGSDAARAHALQALSLVERPRACLVHPSPLCAETARESLSIFQRLGDPSRAALSKVLVAVEGVTGAERETSERLLGEAEQQFLLDRDDWALAVIGFVRMETALKTGDLETAVTTGRATASKFRQLDDPWGLSAILYHLGWGLRQFGRYEDGARGLEEAIDVAAGAGLYNTVQWALADLALVELNLGHTEVARDLFDRANAASQHVGDGAGAVLADYGHGLLALQSGDVGVAEHRLGCAVEGFLTLMTPVWEGWALLGLGRCAEVRADSAAARRLYAQCRDLGRRAGEPGLTASALEGLARTTDAAHTEELYREATELRRRRGRPRPQYQQTWQCRHADA